MEEEEGEEEEEEEEEEEDFTGGERSVACENICTLCHRYRTPDLLHGRLLRCSKIFF
jgi:hypothetical protein